MAGLSVLQMCPDQLLAHLSPLGWEHVNLTGDYILGLAQSGNGALEVSRIPQDDCGDEKVQPGSAVYRRPSGVCRLGIVDHTVIERPHHPGVG